MGQFRPATLILCFLSVACARSAPEPQAGLLDAVQPVKRFDQVEEGTIIEHTFELRNLGSETVSVAPGRGSCGCSIISIDRSVVEPSAIVRVGARLDTSRMSGWVQPRLRLLLTSGQRAEELVLGFEGEVRRLISMTPDPLHFGEVKFGKSPSVFLDIVPMPGSKAQIEKVEVDDSRLQLVPIESSAPDHYQAHLTLSAQNAPSDIEATLSVFVAGDPPRRLERAIRARVRGDLLVAQNIYLRREGRGFEARSIPVTSRTSRHSRLLKAWDPSGLLDVKLIDTETPHALIEAEVVNAERRYEPAVRGVIEIETDSTQERRLEISYVIAEN